MITSLQGHTFLSVDCQATDGLRAQCFPLEIGWEIVNGPQNGERFSMVIKPPVPVSSKVRKLTGISQEEFDSGYELACGGARLSQLISSLPEPRLVVAHYSSYEQGVFKRIEELCGEYFPQFQWLCTHKIASSLLPSLPSFSLRSVAGYFGHSLGNKRRSGVNAHATAIILQQFLSLLDEQGISSSEALFALQSERKKKKGTSRTSAYVTEEQRLSLPHKPGVYKFKNKSGDIIYIGKATNLHSRVNSYFRGLQSGSLHQRALASQIESIEYEETETPLEASLLEPDLIRKFSPVHNTQFMTVHGGPWYVSQFGVTKDEYLGKIGPFSSRKSAEGFFSSVELLVEKTRNVLSNQVRHFSVPFFSWQTITHAFASENSLFLKDFFPLLGSQGNEDKETLNTLNWVLKKLERMKWLQLLCSAEVIFEQDSFKWRRLGFSKGHIIFREWCSSPLQYESKRNSSEKPFSFLEYEKTVVLFRELREFRKKGISFFVVHKGNNAVALQEYFDRVSYEQTLEEKAGEECILPLS